MQIMKAEGRGRSLVRGVLVVAATVVALGVSAPAGSAATTAGYPSALVEYGASTRTVPYLTNSYWGYALRDPWNGSRQTASVMCWYDGDWATGNYRTNRWFRILVWESYDGYSTPRWLFAHASYVYNQPVVRMCNRTSTGYW
jgi:hypothetical protein